MINQTLEAMASPDDTPPSLEADFVALRKLRDEDASGALMFSGGRSLCWADLPQELRDMPLEDQRRSIEVVRLMAKTCLSEKDIWGETKAEGRKSWLADSTSSLLIETICRKVAYECAVAGAREPVAQTVVDRTARVVCDVVGALKATSAKGRPRPGG